MNNCFIIDMAHEVRASSFSIVKNSALNVSKNKYLSKKKYLLKTNIYQKKNICFNKKNKLTDPVVHSSIYGA